MYHVEYPNNVILGIKKPLQKLNWIINIPCCQYDATNIWFGRLTTWPEFIMVDTRFGLCEKQLSLFLGTCPLFFFLFYCRGVYTQKTEMEVIQKLKKLF